MARREEVRERLEAVFRRSPVSDLNQLRRALSTTSRVTVFRALKTVGYHNSYSHTGRFYTLKDIPKFDPQGLWAHRNIRFSRHGTLRATIQHFVEASTPGFTHDELQTLLGLRVHDTLRGLVEVGRVAREEVQGLYVYVSAIAEVGATQLARRQELGPSQPAPVPVAALGVAGVVEVLLAVIRNPGATSARVVARLRAKGLPYTEAQVEEVFARYSLKKTVPSRSRRSPR